MTDQEYSDAMDGELEGIPVELHAALCQLAYEQGHPNGMEEVVSELKELADALRQPLDELVKNIRDAATKKAKKARRA